MKNLKKIMTLLLAVVMVVGMLAGCGSKDAKEEASDPAKVEESKEEAQEVVEEEPEELEYAKIKIVSVGDPDAKASEVFLEELNKKLMRDLNCEAEIQYLTWAEYTDKYALIVAAGEDYDIIFSANWVKYADHSKKGAFLELTEENFQTYMPNSYEMVKTSLNDVRVDGSVYMIPQTSNTYSSYDCYAVRGDIMTEAGLEEITSMQDMEVYLDYVIENYPEMAVLDANAADITFPIANAAVYYEDETGFNYYNDEYVCGVYAQAKKFNAPYILDLTDTANLKYVDDEVLDEYLIKLYSKTKEWREKGYWLEDALSLSTPKEQNYKQGTGAAVCAQLGNVASCANALLAFDPDADPRIYHITDNGTLYKTPGIQNGLSINASSKNPERAMMVCEKLYSDQEYVDLAHCGLEGVHYNLTADGKVETIADAEYGWSEPTNMGIQPTIIRASASQFPQYFEIEAEVGADKAFKDPFAGFIFDNASVLNEYAAMAEVYSRYAPILNLGMSDDVEATYYEFKEAMKTAGLDTVLEEHLKQAQEYYNGLK